MFILDPLKDAILDDNIIFELLDQDTHFRLQFDHMEHILTNLIITDLGGK